MPRIVIKLLVEDLPHESNIKFWGKINRKTFFVLIGDEYSPEDYTRGYHIGLGCPNIPRDPAKERHDLRLFVGSKKNLKEIPLTECEYYPFNMSKETIVKGPGYKFFFPANDLFGSDSVNYTEEKHEKGFSIAKKPATCNGKPIEIFNNNGFIKTQTETVQHINHHRDLKKFKNRDQW